MKLVEAGCVRISERDEHLVKDGAEVRITVCPLAKDGILPEIFGSFGSFDQVSLTPEQCEIVRLCYGGFLDEERCTLMLRQNADESYDVVRYLYDEHWVLEEHVYPFADSPKWEAKHGHQVVFRASAVRRQVAA